MAVNGDGGEFGDTTYTKVFVGGLPWETQHDTMRLYFEQFGEILEAVVITDKHTGRSKGYGFVTFRDPDSAKRACVDATPIIDGRRANCNLACLGARRSHPSSPLQGNRLKISSTCSTSHQMGGLGYLASGLSFPQPGQYPFQQGFQYHVYGFSPYSADYTYPPSYHGPYGAAQYSQIYGGQGMIQGPAAVYPYFQLNPGGSGYPQAQTVGAQHTFQLPTPRTGNIISSLPQQYGGIISTPAPVNPSTGMILSLPQDTVAAQCLSAQQHLFCEQQYTPGEVSEGPSF